MENLKGKKFLLFCLLAVGFAVLVSNVVGKVVADATTDLLLVILSGGLLAISAIIAIRFRGNGNLGRAYLLFVAFALFWFIAEFAYLKSDLLSSSFLSKQQEDLMYLAGYPLLFVFSFYYLKPFWLAITKKMFSYATLGTAVFLFPTLYSMYSFNPNATPPEILWAAIYPIVDALILFPAILGLSLFIKGKVGLLWSFTCIAMFLNIIADSGFFFLDITKSSFSGDPVNILYMWAYILFGFGIYSHVELFQKPKMKSYGNTEDLK